MASDGIETKVSSGVPIKTSSATHSHYEPLPIGEFCFVVACVLHGSFFAKRFAGKALGDIVVELKGIAKEYDLEGGERVTALRQVDLHSDNGCPFTGVRKGEWD